MSVNLKRLHEVERARGYMETCYLDALGIHFIGNGYVSIDRDNPSLLLLHDSSIGRRNRMPFKYLPDSLKLGKMYRKGVADSYTQTAQINKLHNLEHYYLCIMCLSGTFMHEMTHWYKLLITANNRSYRYCGHKFIDVSGQLAYQNYSDIIKRFRKYITNSKSDVKLHALRLRNEPYRQLHVHGLLSTHSADYDSLSAKWTSYLSDKLGYDVSVKVSPLQDIVTHTGAPVLTSDTEPMGQNALANIQMWLKYINRSFKLAFPNTTHPEAIVKKWKSMSYRQRRQYVVDTLINSKGVRCNYNYGYQAKINSLEKRIAKQQRAVADDKAHEQRVNRYASHHKHITSTEQWSLAQGHNPYTKSALHTESMSLFSTNRANELHIEIDISFTMDVHAMLIGQITLIRYNRREVIIHTFEAISAAKQRIKRDNSSEILIIHGCTQKALPSNRAQQGMTIETTVQQLQIGRHKPT